nr:amidohydrolase family protein [uncultured Roseobacter sp.]
MRIDAHQHYWRPSRGDYDWMPQDNAILNRPYVPGDLAPLLEDCGISGTVVVQAAASVAETEYLLGVADGADSILGMVGWIDFEDAGQLPVLERLAAHPKFVGVRPMIQDIPDVDWMLRDDVQWAYQALIDLNLTFDALGFPRHLPNFHRLLTRYPTLRTVIDHGMKPQIARAMAGEEVFADWAEGMGKIAEDTGALCKLSGLVTEAADGWQVDDLRPFSDHILEVLGPARVMWGSDWPVCRLQSEYAGWHNTAQSLTADLSEAARADVFGGTATRFYGLG